METDLDKALDKTQDKTLDPAPREVGMPSGYRPDVDSCFENILTVDCRP